MLADDIPVLGPDHRVGDGTAFGQHHHRAGLAALVVLGDGGLQRLLLPFVVGGLGLDPRQQRARRGVQAAHLGLRAVALGPGGGGLALQLFQPFADRADLSFELLEAGFVPADLDRIRDGFRRDARERRGQESGRGRQEDQRAERAHNFCFLSASRGNYAIAA